MCSRKCAPARGPLPTCSRNAPPDSGRAARSLPKLSLAAAGVSFSQPSGGFVLMFVVVASCALLTAVLALALVRETRLRRTLEALLTKIINRWRQFHGSEPH